jgi:ubiquinone/menaquinone biosynthesis C-methylase UbiE
MKCNVDRLHGMQNDHMKKFLCDEDQKTKSETWFKKNTVDHWRHKRMRDSLLPIISCYPGTYWLTVGDGRYGTDANYLIEKGLKVHASDIQDELLRIAHERNFIKEYSKQNAESLNFADTEFDFVYCKESYHHFPRPSVALYEMLRVSKIGVILQEPKDKLYFDNILRHLSHYLIKLVKIILRKNTSLHSFEVSGNYIYTISPREIQKFALGLHYRFVAYKVQQDHYKEGVEYEIADKRSKLFKKVKLRIRLLEILYKFNIISGGIITCVILKESPGERVIDKLRKSGFKCEVLPSNPQIR